MAANEDHFKLLISLIRDVKPSLGNTAINPEDSLVENLGLELAGYHAACAQNSAQCRPHLRASGLGAKSPHPQVRHQVSSPRHERHCRCRRSAQCCEVREAPREVGL